MSSALEDRGIERPERDALLAWTWDDLGPHSVAERRGGGEVGLSTLRGWWDGNADRGS